MEKTELKDLMAKIRQSVDETEARAAATIEAGGSPSVCALLFDSAEEQDGIHAAAHLHTSTSMLVMSLLGLLEEHPRAKALMSLYLAKEAFEMWKAEHPGSVN